MTNTPKTIKDFKDVPIEEVVGRAKEEKLNAFLEVYDDVEEQYNKQMSNRGSTSVVAGVPIAIKDNILIQGKKASASSKILENYRATYTATAIERLKAAGAVFVGRTNCDEFAMGSSTENSAYGATKNPTDPTRVPGGSSGGSAAAVAAGIVPVALGSDTGGSIRQPAALCGIVGMKPTYGAVSRHGLIAMGSSLDQIGPFTQSVADAEIVFNTIRGNDLFDATSLPDSVWEKKTKEPKVIGVPRGEVEREGIDADVLKNFNESLERLRELGYEIRDVELPHMGYSLAVYYILMPAEVSSNLARFDGVKYGLRVEGGDLLETYLKTRREGFGDEVRRRIILGTYVLSAGYYDSYYGKAVALKRKITEEMKEVFKEVDAIATPTTPSPAFKIGEKSDDPLKMYLEDIFTVPANIAGVPAISLPSGFVKRDGVDLPLGLHLMTNHTHESTLFSVGKKFLGEE